MAVLTSEYRRKTFLQAVAEVLQACGMPDPGTLVGADKNVVIAMGCVNRAAQIIWNWTGWYWKARHVELAVEAGTPWIELPQDFDEIVTEPLTAYGSLRISYIDYDSLVVRVPGFRFVPPSLASVAMIEEREAAEHFADSPRLYSTINEWLMLYPIPNAEFVENNSILVARYRPVYRMMIGDGDEVPVPPALQPAMHFLATGYYKQTMEYSDAQADQRAGIALIEKAVQRMNRHGQDSYSSLPEW